MANGGKLLRLGVKKGWKWRDRNQRAYVDGEFVPIKGVFSGRSLADGGCPVMAPVLALGPNQESPRPSQSGYYRIFGRAEDPYQQ